MTKQSQTRTFLKYVGISVTAVAILGFVWAVYLNSPEEAKAAAGTLSGTVKTPAGTSVNSSDYEVCAFGPMGGNCTTTQNNGTYSTTMNPGWYRVRAQSRPGTPSTFGPSAEVDVEIFDNQTTTKDLQLSNQLMKGKCKKEDGTAVRCDVKVHDAQFSRFAMAFSDPEGNYSLGGDLPAGQYIAEAMNQPDVSGVVPPAPATVTLGGGVVTQDFVFTGAAKKVTGTVKKQNGTAVGASVNASRIDGPGWANTMTDPATGAYTLSLSGGTWMIRPNPAGPDPSATDWTYTEPDVQVQFANDATQETKTVDFLVQSAGSTIKGCMKDESGNALTGGHVDFRTPDGRGTGMPLDSQGCYSLKTVGGSYLVFFFDPQQQYSVPETKIDIGDNETKTLNLVAKKKGAKLVGMVRDAAGNPATNVPVNAFKVQKDFGGGGPGEFSSAMTDSQGKYEVFVVGGGFYGVHLGFGPNTPFVPVNQKPFECEVPSSTSVVTATECPDLNFTVTKADAKIIVRVVKEDGSVVSNFFGCAFARPFGSFGERCEPVNGGKGEISVSTSVSTTWEVGCHSQPNSPYSCGESQQATVASGSETQVNVKLQENNAKVTGAVVDSTGFPLSSCPSGMVFMDGPSGHFQGQIEKNCNFSVSLTAGTFHLNANLEGCLQRPPDPEGVLVLNGQTVTRNLVCVKGDATITAKLIGTNGKPVRGFVFCNNRPEINESRELRKGPPGEKGGTGADLGFNKKMPCGAADVTGVIKCCTDAKNKAVCEAFAIPEGPNGCKNAYTCVQQCKTNPQMCKDAEREGSGTGPKPGESFVGPGGCKSEDECRKYCSDPSHFEECNKFRPPEGAMSVKVATRGVAALAEKGTSSTSDGPKGPAGFDNMINIGAPTDDNGVAKVQALSGHVYECGANVPPEVVGVPPRAVKVDLTKEKNPPLISLQLRESNATIEGKVTLSGKPAQIGCFVHAWADDGGNGGQPVNPGGQYKINVNDGTVWHVGADCQDGQNFYRSKEFKVVVKTGDKKAKQDLEVKKGAALPDPVTSTYACASPTTVELTNGTRLEVPGGSVDDDDDGQCTITAKPKVGLIATMNAKPEDIGYDVIARDANSQEVTNLNSSVTITIPYTDDNLKSEDDDDAKTVMVYDSTQGGFQDVSSVTRDETNNTLTALTTHLSTYTVVDTSGTSDDSQVQTSVTTTTKKGVTTIKVGDKTIKKPFKCEKSGESLYVKTKGTDLHGQLVIVGSSCDPSIKIYDTNAKLKKQVKTSVPGYASVEFGDVTGDGNPDVVGASKKGAQVVNVWELGKKFKTKQRSVTVGSGTGATVVTIVEAEVKGSGNLVAATEIGANKFGNFKAFTFKKGKFAELKKSQFNTASLKAKGKTISYTPPKPLAKKVTPGAVSSSDFPKLVSAKIVGKNFKPDTTAIVCDNVGTIVSYKKPTELVLTMDASELSPGKCKVTLTNPDGGSSVSGSILTVN